MRHRNKNTNKQKIRKMELKELQTIVNQHFKICWLCGRKDCLTEHHVIPQRYAGVAVNLKIPMCKNCQTIIHKEEEFVALIRRLMFGR